VRIEARFKSPLPEPVTCILYAEFPGHFEIDKSRNFSVMNIIQISKILTKHLKYFQGVYPIDLLPSTIIKHSIFAINLDKRYISGSHWVAVCFSDSGYAEYLIRTVYHHTNLKSCDTCKTIQFLGHLIATEYRV
jgi:hypothetical protein